MIRDSCVCSPEERTVLDMVRCWPGIPAIVTYDPERGWSVGTSESDVQSRLCAMGTGEKNKVVRTQAPK